VAPCVNNVSMPSALAVDCGDVLGWVLLFVGTVNERRTTGFEAAGGACSGDLAETGDDMATTTALSAAHCHLTMSEIGDWRLEIGDARMCLLRESRLQNAYGWKEASTAPLASRQFMHARMSACAPSPITAPLSGTSWHWSHLQFDDCVDQRTNYRYVTILVQLTTPS
jgi:hypothetical protein